MRGSALSIPGFRSTKTGACATLRHRIADSSSLLSLYRSLLALRRSHDALAIGDVTLVDAAEDVLAYQRRHAGECLLIALNLGDADAAADAAHGYLRRRGSCIDRCLLSTRPLRPMDGTLAPDEGLVLRLKEKH